MEAHEYDYDFVEALRYRMPLTGRYWHRNKQISNDFCRSNKHKRSNTVSNVEKKDGKMCDPNLTTLFLFLKFKRL